MKIKVFEAHDMATGLKMVKEALGPDALILSTRTVRTGAFGVLGKPMMEITASVDSDAVLWLKKGKTQDKNHQESNYRQAPMQAGSQVSSHQVTQQELHRDAYQERQQTTYQDAYQPTPASAAYTATQTATKGIHYSMDPQQEDNIRMTSPERVRHLWKQESHEQIHQERPTAEPPSSATGRSEQSSHSGNWNALLAAQVAREELTTPHPRAQQPTTVSPQETAPPDAPVAPELHRELTELRSMVKGLSLRLSSLNTAALHRPYIEPEFAVLENKKLALAPVTAFLCSYGLNQETALMLSRFTRDAIAQQSDLTVDELCAILQSAMSRLFTTHTYLVPPAGRQRRISLVGSTGVGKTTTLAKIAAHFLNRFHARVAFITIDTYRIAAIEQLKVYGDIMNLPVEVVIKPSDLDRALEKFRDYDLVLIDTAGRSPRNTLDVEELVSFLGPHPDIENNLLLSAATRENELEEAIRQFSLLPLSTFVFSKIDECAQLGVLLNIHYRYDTPISFLTNGQRVPEDLLSPSPADLAAFIMNGNKKLNDD